MTGKDETKGPAIERGFSVLGLGEIAIRCSDLAAMTAFYRDVIGLEMLADRGGLIFFRLPNGVAGHTAILALFDEGRNPERPAPDGQRSTLHHLALTVTPEGQQAACRWFDAQGVEWRAEEFAWIGWRGIFVTDPEGNRVELVAAGGDGGNA
ncbi:VOC family protein [Pseudohoeflea suaedae]|uniref:VOC family protein n=1 Tax=Pseudohoeflea suaedae TaxID=877384 RepID=UPI0019D5C9D1|nr:VOC family protein [Pseudohoeflea suaedae]